MTIQLVIYWLTIPLTIGLFKMTTYVNTELYNPEAAVDQLVADGNTVILMDAFSSVFATVMANEIFTYSPAISKSAFNPFSSQPSPLIIFPYSPIVIPYTIGTGCNPMKLLLLKSKIGPSM